MSVVDLDDLSPGRRLRVHRVLAGLKLWELATRSGVPQGRISELENDRRLPRADELAKLSAVLDGLAAERRP